MTQYTKAIVASYFYDATNRMVKGTNQDGNESVYNFNGLGTLVNNTSSIGGMKDASKDYVLDYTAFVPRELTEVQNNEFIGKYVYGGRNRISADITANAESVKMRYHSDRLGSTTHLTDKTGKVQAMAGYDEWGNRGGFKPLNFGDRSLDLVHNYTGHMFDAVLGQYYAKARMYSAGNRRFLAEDTHWGPNNLIYGDILYTNI